LSLADLFQKQGYNAKAIGLFRELVQERPYDARIITLLAADDQKVVIMLDKNTKDHEMLAVEIEQLSNADREYVRSKETWDSIKSEGDKHASAIAMQRNPNYIVGEIRKVAGY
jgi:hypothetical protein